MTKGGKGITFSPENIFKNLQVVQENRGKKVRTISILICLLLLTYPP